ncbi:DUF1015 domain-containing protein [Lutispora thermophila]|uniref:Uncharacterized conserved protein, DUF1015 family n=1 Tax=Lutispora thermophila DSM 19022 TaxID=1122184 RepID=A0A1M6EL21_9FIRM|nr:DUF1015 family protein [Lutispora thermophila]SHI86096.1 Uncharacterized conserved protein, DUF1015 family [Lutispora thermophila DSM 19022]
MAVLKAFKAIRPKAGLASKIAALPYDVMNSQEAMMMVEDNPYSFLHVDKAEIDLDESIDIYDKRVYEKAKDNLRMMEEKGWLMKDKQDMLYIYKLVMDGNEQVGLVGCVSVDDYINNKIKKHEYTREDKEKDRINHIKYCNANTGPIFLMYKGEKEIDEIIANWMRKNSPVYDFTAEDGIEHMVWAIEDQQVIDKLIYLFYNIDDLYIADGHHRAASAVKVAMMKREENQSYTGEEEFNYFLGVLFPHNQLKIMDYNRVVKDLNNYTVEEFLEKIKENFIVEEHGDKRQYKPRKKHDFGMYLNRKWYKLTAKEGTYDDEDAVGSLDVSILQDNLLNPVLGIKDPRIDDRIDFVGGIRGLGELEKRVEERMAVAFALYPTRVEDLMTIADQGKVMPPKSTWFEPKLRSGLFIHELE